jgi:tRNA threonylcarbamoyladenosine biosynthesis protein TsaE
MSAALLDLPDEAATIGLAEQLAAALPASPSGWTILLDGDLGAGKSTFARALIRAKGHRGAVPSPTYTLVEPYELADITIYHADLYRIAGEDELRYLGWNELEDGLRLVEWPDRAPGLTESADVQVLLQYHGPGRQAQLTGLSPRGRQLIAGLQD